jgi:hypothetical protein
MPGKSHFNRFMYSGKPIITKVDLLLILDEENPTASLSSIKNIKGPPIELRITRFSWQGRAPPRQNKVRHQQFFPSDSEHSVKFKIEYSAGRKSFFDDCNEFGDDLVAYRVS